MLATFLRRATIVFSILAVNLSALGFVSMDGRPGQFRACHLKRLDGEQL